MRKKTKNEEGRGKDDGEKSTVQVVLRGEIKCMRAKLKM